VNQMQGMLLTRLRTGSNGTNAAEQWRIAIDSDYNYRLNRRP
jgi:hypothetical protein